MLYGARPERLLGHSVNDTRILILTDRSRPCFFHSQQSTCAIRSHARKDHADRVRAQDIRY